MVRGYSDYSEPNLTDGLVQDTDGTTFSGDIVAGDLGYFEIDEPPEGQERVVTALTVACDYDEAIHFVYMYRVGDTWSFWETSFISSGQYLIPHVPFSSATKLRVYIENGSDHTINFYGTVHYFDRLL